jgi:hypothetical protein
MYSSQERPRAANERIASKFRTPRRFHLYVLCFISVAITSTFAGFQTSRFNSSAWAATSAVHAATVASSPASPSPSPAAADFTRMPPQEQAQSLLERALAREAGSVDLITKNVDIWRGHLSDTGHLYDLVHAGMNSDDIRVRGAAVEIDLAANNLAKSPQTVVLLVHKLHDSPADRPWTLWRLGALGNRGVQPDLVLAQLLTYSRDRDEDTRYWAVEGLAVLGTDATVDPLLDRFAHDHSSRVRQRAACNLAQSGMLTRKQRLAAIPELLNFFDDDAMDSATRGWVYGALRIITGVQLGNDANAWRKWWAKRDTTTHNAHIRTKTLFA